MAFRIQLRRDTAAQWEINNPLLLQGEAGYETDTRYLKVGDGITYWNDLQYFVGMTGPVGPTGGTGPAGPTGPTGPLGYKVYRSKIDMTTGSATVFENTLGTTLTWTTATGSLTTGSVVSLIGQNNVFVQATSAGISGTSVFVSASFQPSPWSVTINQAATGGNPVSSQGVYIEILIYP